MITRNKYPILYKICSQSKKTEHLITNRDDTLLSDLRPTFVTGVNYGVRYVAVVLSEILSKDNDADEKLIEIEDFFNSLSHEIEMWNEEHFHAPSPESKEMVDKIREMLK